MAGPSSLGTAAVLVGLQGLALLGLSVSVLLRAAGAGGWPAGLLGLGGGLLLVLLALGLRGARRSARSLVVLLELIGLPVAAGLLQGGVVAVGAPLAAADLLVLALLATPAARGPFPTGPRRPG